MQTLSTHNLFYLVVTMVYLEKMSHFRRCCEFSRVDPVVPVALHTRSMVALFFASGRADRPLRVDTSPSLWTSVLGLGLLFVVIGTTSVGLCRVSWLMLLHWWKKIWPPLASALELFPRPIRSYILVQTYISNNRKTIAKISFLPSNYLVIT